MSTYRVTIKYWDRHYGDGHVQFSRRFEARRSTKADQAAIDALEEGLRLHSKPQGREAQAWAERSDPGEGPGTLRAYDGSSGVWVRVEPRRAAPTKAREARHYPKPQPPPRRFVSPTVTDDAWNEDVRLALGTVGHNRSFSMRDLTDYLNGRVSSNAVRWAMNKLARAGYVGRDENGYHVTQLGWDWIEGANRSIEEQRIAHETQGHHVADFNTLDDLISHARQEGATHVLHVDDEVHLYFLRRDGQYEKAEVWQKDGYWHTQGPGSRTIVRRPPSNAKPIAVVREHRERSLDRLYGHTRGRDPYPFPSDRDRGISRLAGPKSGGAGAPTLSRSAHHRPAPKSRRTR